MFGFKKNSISLKSASSNRDFVGITHHYNKSTLLSRNGQLIEIIKIPGKLPCNSDKLGELKQNLRRAVWHQKDKDKYAFWIHTIKSSADITGEHKFSHEIAQQIDDAWQDQCSWKNKYFTEIYLSVVCRAPSTAINNLNSYFNSLNLKTVKNFYSDFFALNATTLSEFTDNIVSELSNFGACKLEATEFENGYSSPAINFLKEIIQLRRSASSAIKDTDIAYDVAVEECELSTDLIEVKARDSSKFLSMITFKDMSAASEVSFIDILNIPVESIITEVFYFTDQKKVKDAFGYANHILDVSKEAGELRDVKSMDRIFASDAKYVSYQTSFAVIGESKEELKNNLSNASSIFADLGIVHVIEDINLEQFFWAQIPGNFSFLRKMRPAVIEDTANFAYLSESQIKPSGGDSHYTTIFPKPGGGHHYFSIACGDRPGVSSLAIISAKSGGKTSLANFLISQQLSYKPKILSVSAGDSSKIFIESLGGRWIVLGDEIIEQGFNTAFFDSEITACNLANIKEPAAKSQSIYSAIQIFASQSGDKLLFIDDFFEIFDPASDFASALEIFDLCANSGIALIVALDASVIGNLASESEVISRIKNFDTKFFTAADNTPRKLAGVLDIPAHEIELMARIAASERPILIQQNSSGEVCSFNIDNSPFAIRILSASFDDLSIYKNIKAQSAASTASILDLLINTFNED